MGRQASLLQLVRLNIFDKPSEPTYHQSGNGTGLSTVNTQAR